MNKTATDHEKQTPQKYESNPFKVIFRGFSELFKVNQGWAIALLILTAFGGSGSSFNYNASSPTPSSNPAVSTASSSLPPAAIIAIIVFVVLFVLAMVFITTMFSGIVAYVSVKTIEGESVGFKEPFKAAWSKFWTVLLAQFVVGLKILGGFLLFIVPGIRAALRYRMVLLPVFAEDKKAMEAIREVKVLTKDHLLEVFGMVTAAGIIPLVGGLLAIGGNVVMFPQLKALKASGAPKPKVHWLNYLGFLLVALFMLFIIGMVALVATFANS